MRLTLLLADRKRSGPSATFARWLRFGSQLPSSTSGADDALRQCFEFLGTHIPTAALTHSLDAQATHVATDQQSTWVRADPAYVMADGLTLRLAACGEMDLSINENVQLAQTLKPLFGDFGLVLDTQCRNRWYVKCSSETRLPEFSPPGDALGDDLARHLPRGYDSVRWRALLNEVQIALHQHAVNAQRVQRGLVPVNSVWFFGAGRLPEWVRSTFSRVYSAEGVVCALANIAGIASNALPESFATMASSQVDECLLDLREQFFSPDFERCWLAQIDTALAIRKVQSVHLLFASGERYRVTRWHRWRVWRRARESK